MTLPEPPEGVEECLRQAFPDIPRRAMTKGEVIELVARAKILDRTKTQCGDRAVTYIKEVRRVYAK